MTKTKDDKNESRSADFKLNSTYRVDIGSQWSKSTFNIKMRISMYGRLASFIRNVSKDTSEKLHELLWDTFSDKYDWRNPWISHRNPTRKSDVYRLVTRDHYKMQENPRASLNIAYHLSKKKEKKKSSSLCEKSVWKVLARNYLRFSRRACNTTWKIKKRN